MRTNYRMVLAGVIIAAVIESGCALIISSDDSHHHDETCSDCHYVVDVYGKRVADTTVVIASEKCPR